MNRVKMSRCQNRVTEKFNNAITNTARVGKARTWFVPVLKMALRSYYDLHGSCGGIGSRELLGMLLSGIDRDRRTKSRWVAALYAAVKGGVRPKDLRDWLKQGGGVSGRSRVRK